MNRTQFLKRLETEASLNLGPEMTQALVDEVSAHLDESIQSRLELGEAPEVAELNAIAAFAKPETLVESMERVHHRESPHDARLLVYGLSLILALTFWMEIAKVLVSTFPLMWWVILLVPQIAIIVLSFKMRTPKWGSLRNLLIATFVLVGGVQPVLTLNTYAYDGMGYFPALSARQEISELEAKLSNPHSFPKTGDGSVLLQDGGDRARIVEVRDSLLRAINAPLWERYTTNANQTAQMIVFGFGIVFVLHLLPVSIRQRIDKTRRRRRRLRLE